MQWCTNWNYKLNMYEKERKECIFYINSIIFEQKYGKINLKPKNSLASLPLRFDKSN